MSLAPAGRSSTSNKRQYPAEASISGVLMNSFYEHHKDSIRGKIVNSIGSYEVS